MGRCVLFIILFGFLLAGCEDQPPPAGVVATVNGEPIYLHSLETLLDSRTSDQGGIAQNSMEDMQKSYAHALGVLVTHTLVRQELAHRGIDLPEEEQAAILDELNDEAGEGGLDGFLREASIRKDDWQQLMRDYLALETFRNQVLLPGIKVELDEIRTFYDRHKEDFKLPAHIRACFLNAPDKAALEALCNGFARQIVPESPLAQCMDMETEMLPPPWAEEQKEMKLNSCGKFREENDTWKSVVILSRSRARTARLPEVYALVEKRLLEQKQQAAFDAWLAAKVAASSILVAPELNASLSLAFVEEDSPNVEQQR